MWWWTYVFHIKACGTWPGGQTGRVHHLTGVERPALSFYWSDGIPVISDGLDSWRDSIANRMGNEDILVVRGVAYRDETYGEGTLELARRRSDVVRDILAQRIVPDRIRTEAIIGALAADIKDHLFPGYRMEIFTRNAHVREGEDHTVIHFPYDSLQFVPEELSAYFQTLSSEVRPGSAVRLQPCPSEGPGDSTVLEGINHRLSLLKEMLISEGLGEGQVRTDSTGHAALPDEPGHPGWTAGACFVISMN